MSFSLGETWSFKHISNVSEVSLKLFSFLDFPLSLFFLLLILYHLTIFFLHLFFKYGCVPCDCLSIILSLLILCTLPGKSYHPYSVIFYLVFQIYFNGSNHWVMILDNDDIPGTQPLHLDIPRTSPSQHAQIWVHHHHKPFYPPLFLLLVYDVIQSFLQLHEQTSFAFLPLCFFTC